MTKVCKKCGIEKDVLMFGKKAKNKDGLSKECKECRNRTNKKYIAVYLAYAKKYRQENKDKINEYERKNTYKYRARKNETTRKRRHDKKVEYHERYKDMIKIYNKIYYEKNKEELKTANKEFHLKHPEHRAVYEIKRRWGVEDPPKELIELKMAQLRLFRAVREKRLEEKGNE